MIWSIGRKTRERRKSRRFGVPSLEAVYWDGSTSNSHLIRDIGYHGAGIETSAGWCVGTLVRLTIRHTGEGASESPAIWSRVVRTGIGEMCVEFIFFDKSEAARFHAFLSRNGVTSMANGSGRKIRSQSGQALLELALVLPLMFLLIINVVNFGGLFYAWVTVANAARTGAQRLMMGGSFVHSPSPPALSDVVTLVTDDLMSLPNRASALVKVCKNNSGTITCVGSGGVAPPADPESSFVVGSVDVTYTYKPFVSFWSFPKLGVYMTLGTTTVHRQAVMRLAGG